jgi:Helix-turn-helix domain
VTVNPKDVLSLKEASTYLAMDEAALTRLASERRIPALQLNGDWVFSKKSIDKWRSRQQPSRG